MMNQEISKRELELVMEQPAVCVNKFFFTITPLGLRLTLAEHPNEDFPPYVRGAFILDFASVAQLGEALTTMVKLSKDSPSSKAQ